MHASEYLNAARQRIIEVQLLDTKNSDKNVGRAKAFLVDQEKRIAILLSDCGAADDTNLKAGDFVQISGHPETGIQRIISADSIRPDAKPGRVPPGHPYLPSS